MVGNSRMWLNQVRSLKFFCIHFLIVKMYPFFQSDSNQIKNQKRFEKLWKTLLKQSPTTKKIKIAIENICVQNCFGVFNWKKIHYSENAYSRTELLLSASRFYMEGKTIQWLVSLPFFFFFRHILIILVRIYSISMRSCSPLCTDNAHSE